MSLNDVSNLFDTFCIVHKKFLDQPIIKSFLDNPYHLYLTKNALINPTSNNKKILDDAFKLHFKTAKRNSYLSKLIYFSSINFDKKERTFSNNELLILDNDTSTINSYSNTSHNIFNSLLDVIENPKLFSSIKKLSIKQLDILSLKYFHNMKNVDIAFTLNCSPQYVSKTLIKCLHLIKKDFLGGV